MDARQFRCLWPKMGANAFADRLLRGLVCALLWCEAATSGEGSLRRAELRALRQLYNATGGPQGAWLNDTGWRGGGGGAPDPCDGRSWFGIYDWRGYGGGGLPQRVQLRRP